LRSSSPGSAHLELAQRLVERQEKEGFLSQQQQQQKQQQKQQK